MAATASHVEVLMNIQINFSIKSQLRLVSVARDTHTHCTAEPVFLESLTLWPFLGTWGQQWASRQEVCPWGLKAWPVSGILREREGLLCPFTGGFAPRRLPGWDFRPPAPTPSCSPSQAALKLLSSCTTPLGLLLEADDDLLNPDIWTFQRYKLKLTVRRRECPVSAVTHCGKCTHIMLFIQSCWSLGLVSLGKGYLQRSGVSQSLQMSDCCHISFFKKMLRSDMQDFDFCQIRTLKKNPFPIATLWFYKKGILASKK